MTDKPIVEQSQEEWDAEEANAKLRILAAAVDHRDHCRAEVARLKRELKRAQEAAKRADWDVGATAQRIAQHVKRRAKR